MKEGTSHGGKRDEKGRTMLRMRKLQRMKAVCEASP